MAVYYDATVEGMPAAVEKLAQEADFLERCRLQAWDRRGRYAVPVPSELDLDTRRDHYKFLIVTHGILEATHARQLYDKILMPLSGIELPKELTPEEQSELRARRRFDAREALIQIAAESGETATYTLFRALFAISVSESQEQE